jgi:hypothetical protein
MVRENGIGKGGRKSGKGKKGEERNGEKGKEWGVKFSRRRRKKKNRM